MALRSYQDLQVWQKSIDFVEFVYALSRTFPNKEKFGLTSQIRRAAVSVSANIAEGYGRSHKGDYLRHLSIARGSLLETETHLVIAKRLGFLSQDDADKAWSSSQEIGRMLLSLINSLQRLHPTPSFPTPSSEGHL